jgi:alkylmercury lyase
MSASIFATMTTAFSSPETAFEWKLLHRFWELLAESGEPVSLDTLTRALACERWHVAQVLEQYPEVEYDPRGNLVGAGLTLRPTPHQLVLEERSLYTWCAPDALYMPVVLGQSAQILSACPVTGTRIEVTLTPEHLEALRPASTVVTIARDGRMVKRLKETGCIRQDCCENQFFFASGEVVAPWISEHTDFLVVPVEEAFEGMRAFARHQMALVTCA